MVAGLEPVLLVTVVGIVSFGGLVKGLVGFGYGIAGTALLALVIDPATAVIVMILPALAANLSLVRELEPAEVRSCLRRFWPYVVAAGAGTLLGTAALESIPRQALAGGLGLLTLGYVASRQSYATLQSGRLGRLGRPVGARATVGIGLVSGVVFGASNIGIQIVAYLDSMELDRSTFVGVLAMVLVGVTGLRVVAAFALGLYEGSALSLSLLAVAPGLVGVAVGGVGRRHLSERLLNAGTIALLLVVGVRLTAGGAGL